MKLSNRWQVLALLFTVRLSMAFQFQSVASVSPLLVSQFGLDLGAIGTLIGLYMAPGLVFAVPGGRLAGRYGDKQIVMFGLALMIVGGLAMALGSAWQWQFFGRLLAGIGGVLLNVVMSKMVTDWFSGKELATAMAIFVNSWPCGIALCLMTLPAVALAQGVAAASLICVAFSALGLLLLAVLYVPAARLQQTSMAIWPSAPVVKAVVVAGMIWGLFNAAMAMVFGFGTAMLAERGWSLTSAGAVTSLTLWLVGLSVPLGGILADRFNRPTRVMFAGFILSAFTLIAASRTEAVVMTFAMLGLAGGLSAGPIMSLPARVLRPSARAIGMGLFFTLFYLIVVMAPAFAGWLASRTGSASAAFDFGAALAALCVPAYLVFDRLAVRAAALDHDAS